MIKNRRRYVRIDKAFVVSFHEANILLRSGGRNKNISEGGICLPLDQYIRVGSLLELEIRSDDFNSPVKALARIVWIAKQEKSKFPYEAGLEFLKILPLQKDMLRDYINRYLAAGGQQNVSWID